MYQIKQLTFDTGDMKEAARKHLESCMAYITAYKQTSNDFEIKNAAIEYGMAIVWLDMLCDIDVLYNEEDEHIQTMLDIALEYQLDR